MLNYYEILEVSEKASKEVIEKAYKALAKKYHPDLNQEDKKTSEVKMKEINEAFEVLIDDNKRANYDNILAKKREIQKAKEELYNNNSENTANNMETTDKIYYSNNPEDDKFIINTNQMDEKTRKKLQAKLQERYLEAYDEYLRQHGYKLKYKWTFKRFFQAFLVVLIAIIVFTILFFIPPIHKYCLKLYEENMVIQLLVNLVISVFDAILSIFR